MFKVSITAIEALILISLCSSIEDDSILDETTIKCLRNIIREAESKKDGAIEGTLCFSLIELQKIENNLPLYGTSDESSFSPLRIKISSKLSQIESSEEALLLLEEVSDILNFGGGENASTSKGSNNTENKAKRKTGSGQHSKNKPRHSLPDSERTCSQNNRRCLKENEDLQEGC